MGRDNLHAGIHYPYTQFSDWDNRRFVQYMRETFTSQQLKRMGFEPDKFNIRQYLVEKRETKPNEQLIAEPIIHEYIRFYYIAIIESVLDYGEQLKRTAIKFGRPVPAFYGNTASAHNYRVVGIPMTALVDVAWIEDSGWASELPTEVDSMRADTTLIYKIGRAATHYRRPVWSAPHTFVRDWTNKRMVQGLATAEAHSCGGVMWQELSTWQPGSPGWDAHRHHDQFVSRNRVLFTDREAPVDVAVVKSIPSLFWRWFSSLEVERPHMDNLSAAARLLEEQHIPYEVLMFGHPDLFDDMPQLNRLHRYRTLIIPNADCISDKQARAITGWVKRGGKLLLWGEVGTRDEELRRRPEPVFSTLIDNPGEGEVVSTSAAAPIAHPDTGHVYEEEGLSQAYLEGIPGAGAGLAELLRQEDTLVETDLPSLTWLNVWRHGAGPMISVQMVNYDIKPENDTVTEQKDFVIRLRVDDSAKYARADYFFTDYSTLNSPPPAPKQLPFIQKDGYVEVKVPHLEIFGVLVFSSANELAARTAAAETRKWYERLKIARRCPGQKIADVAELLHQAEDYLGQIQGNVRVADFSPLVEPGKELADQLRKAVEEVTAETTALKENCRNEALQVDADYKFDFGEAEVAEGWTEVTTNTDYTPERGYGWVSKGEIAAVDVQDADTVDDMHRDYIRSRNPSDYIPWERGKGNHWFPVFVPPNNEAQFRVDTPNGEYLVTIVTGDYFPHYNGLKTSTTQVDINGKPVIYGDRYHAGYYQNRVCRVNVKDGHLILRFWSSGYGPFYFNNCQWLINGLVIQRPEQKLTSLAAEYLTQAELRSDAAIRDWYIIGPFDDNDCTGLDTMYGPEAAPALNVTYQGKKGNLKWKKIPRLKGKAPYVSLSSFFDDRDKVAGFALTRVYCETRTQAVLVTSTTQLGAGYLNGKQIFRDEYCAGLLPAEERVPITLKEGWNTIVVKSLNHWGDEWALWAGLFTPNGKPFKYSEHSKGEGGEN